MYLLASCPGIKKGVGTPRGQREGAGSLRSWLGVPMRQGHLPAPGAQEGRDGQVQPVHLPPVLGRSCTWMTCQECFWFLTGSAWRPAHPLGDLHTCAPGRAGRLISDPSMQTSTALSGLGWGVKVSALPSPSPPPPPSPSLSFHICKGRRAGPPPGHAGIPRAHPGTDEGLPARVLGLIL